MVSELERLIETRRDLHRHPELAFEEHRTAGIAAERLRAAGYEVQTGIASTGVIGTLRGSGSGPTLLLRADMDALPIQEETSHHFPSTVPGKMHACGHDSHVAVGLAVAERLAKKRAEWAGEIRYCFQPAEEGAGGARRMIGEGALEGVDAALGLHIWLGLPSGVVGVVDGPQMAGAREFRITIEGRGGHGAIPEETIDATLVASQVVVALQTIVSRNVSPLDTAVVTVGSLHAGTAHNIIAANAVLEGTLRAFRLELLHQLEGHVTRVVNGVCAALGATAEVTFSPLTFPPTVNDPALAAVVRQAVVAVAGEEKLRTSDDVRTMGAEDFAEFSTRVPGCFFFVGARDEAKKASYPHHSPHFDLDESALPLCVDVLERAAREYIGAAVGEG
jgi:amidohydrolase